jgi:hypothetical protein
VIAAAIGNTSKTLKPRKGMQIMQKRKKNARTSVNGMRFFGLPWLFRIKTYNVFDPSKHYNIFGCLVLLFVGKKTNQKIF